ncbi:MAG: Asp-tRNA(Asn)/Glu-tRNA(Gln) amidotransferase subunit GatA [Spirochaetaceae bacterium]|jgi:aspartyl-tRNA(Asn)/glutamyl-tRNA(Gln) amidotransferase subunit A|nr:Asp-tRNA(Asn)/Glu-tRNA(Gln) amidotransferase subunit GatA [Spirochaetaceae bacterium]
MAFSWPDGFLAYAGEWEEKIGAFLEFKSQPVEDDGEGPLFPEGGPLPGSPLPEEARALLEGFPFAVKDNIAVQGLGLTCASRLLEDFRSPYTATAVRKLLAAGGKVMGKTNLDEFGMGSSTDLSALKRTNNPWDLSRVPGGSSGGSAAAVAAGLAPYALGSDTGGSVRCPASFCGVLGLKPTYGAVSRYGLVAYASSLEGIGVLADSTARCRAVFAAMAGADPLDQTSRDPPPSSPPLYGPGRGGPKLIGVLSAEAIARAVAADGSSAGGPVREESLKSGDEAAALRFALQSAALEEEVARAFEEAKRRLRELGHTLVEVEIPSLRYGVPAYYTIAAAEASANLARFDGIRYGKRPDWAENPDDLIDRARESGFGAEVKLRILLGTFVLRSGFQDRYYLRAQRIRQGIRRNFELFLGAPGGTGPDGTGALPGGRFCDALLLPVFPRRAFGRGGEGLSPFAQKAADLYTCCANLAGLPALAFPVGVEGGLPVGVQLLGRAFSEGVLLDIVEDYEERYPFPHPAGYRSFWNDLRN